MCINISLTLFFKTTTTKQFRCVRDTVGVGRGNGVGFGQRSFSVLWSDGSSAGAHQGTGRTRARTLMGALRKGVRSKARATTILSPAEFFQSAIHIPFSPQDFILVSARVPRSGRPCPKPELLFDFSGCK